MAEFNYEQLSPGIRNAVRWFHEQGLETVDSGDGSNFANGMECAIEDPMVVICTDPGNLTDLADELQKALAEKDLVDFRIEASYSPGEPTFILVLGKDLLLLK